MADTEEEGKEAKVGGTVFVKECKFCRGKPVSRAEM